MIPPAYADTPVAAPAAAQTINGPSLIIPIPNVKFSDVQVVDTGGARIIDVPWIADYVAGVYKYSIGLAALMATVMFMVGGFQYLTAGGDVSRVKAGKKRATDALIGMLLVFGAYAILNLVNPNTLTFSALRIKTVARNSFTMHDPAPTVSGGTSVAGASADQSCFRKTFGASDAEVSAQVTQVNWLGHKVTVHKLAAADWQAAFSEMESASPNSPIGKWMTIVRGEAWYDGSCAKGSAFGGHYEPRMAKLDAKSAAGGKKTCDSCDLHVFGLAVDIDPCNNPSLRNDPIKTNMSPELVQMMASHHLYWGGLGWSGKSDPNFIGYHDAMHYEWHGMCYQ